MKDLRQWIDVLEREAPEELVRVRKSVDPARFEVTAVMEKMESERRFQSVLFESPRSHDHGDHGFQLLLNTFGTFAKMAVALDLPPDTLKSRLMEEDASGGLFIKNLRDTAVNNTGFVVFYYLNPAHNNTIEKKLGYVEKVDDTWWLGSGIYGENVTLPNLTF